MTDEFETSPARPPTVSKSAELQTLLAAATPGPWHHVNAGRVATMVRTIHGTVPAEPIDYVSTWPGLGTPPGHRVVINRDSGVRSADMALIAEAPALAAEVLALRAQAAASAERIKDLEAAIQKAVGRLQDYADMTVDQWDETVADGGITAWMVVRQELQTVVAGYLVRALLKEPE